jgi:hypothetical protein
MSELVDALHQELQSLEAELAADPRFLKLAKIRELLAIYGVASAPTAPAGARTERLEPTKSTKVDRIRAETRASIERSGGVAHRQDILAALISAGIMGDERSPIASLAAYLTEMKSDFQSLGAGKWTVRVGADIDRHRTIRRKVIRHKHIPGSMADRVAEAAVHYLREKGSRAESPEILRAIRDRGLDVKDITSCLSHSHLFDNVRGQGYGLVEWSERDRSQRSETPGSGQLSGAPRPNGGLPLNL